VTVFPHTPWLQVLPDDTPVDAITPRAQAHLRAKAAKGTWVNIDQWTCRIVDVPLSQPHVPVHLDPASGWNAKPPSKHGDLAGALVQHGVPIPPGTVPQADRDGALVVRKRDQLGRVVELYELWRYRIHPEDGRVFCSHAGRKVNVQAPTQRGHYIDWGYAVPPGSGRVPYHYEHRLMGVTATSLPFDAGLVTREDLLRGWCDHPVGVMLTGTGSAPHRWPAQRRDFASHMDLPQGTRGRLRHEDAVIPEGASRALACVLRTLRTYGWVFWDTTMGDVGITLRFEEGTREFLDGGPSNLGVGAIPWHKSLVLPENYRRP